jgi:long-chain fatty acid transport protein
MKESIMRKVLTVLAILSVVVVLTTPSAFATNGDNLIAIGPIARSMGGVGIAAPQDAISAVFANPAAMCFGAYCPGSEFNFAGTGFIPKVDAKVTQGGSTYKADSANKIYSIPAIGLSAPLSSAPRFWRFGLAAYGVTGLGVDYRDTEVDQQRYAGFGGNPLVAGAYTQLQIMKFAPAIAFQPFEALSFGLAFHIDYASLDLRNGSSPDYGMGVQAGIIYRPADSLSLGLTYISPQNVDHKHVADFDGDGRGDTLKLESPQQIGFGAAYTAMEHKLLLEADVRWLNWADANGYKEFDWENQWVFSVGAQMEVMPKLFLRAGYNYGKNPVKDHNNFVGTDISTVQGKMMPTYYNETFRIIGFPAVVEQHVSLGMGYEFSPTFAINLGYMHAFEKSIKENGTDLTGQPVSLESSLSEDSLDFGLTWRF